MNHHTTRPGRFLKPARSLLTLFLLLFCTLTFATPTTPTTDFIDNHDGTVTHKTTGLVWMRCSMGQTWDGTTCTGTAKTYTYADAVALTTTFAGNSDWRLPNIAELHTIVEWETYNPAINTALFPNTPTNNYYWSSSPVAYGSNVAWDIDFSSGYDVWNFKYSNYYVRLVRVGQWPFSFSLTTPSSDFTDNQDGTVTHKRSCLTWQRCSVGQTWNGSSCSGSPTQYNWTTANQLTSTFAGHND